MNGWCEKKPVQVEEVNELTKSVIYIVVYFTFFNDNIHSSEKYLPTTVVLYGVFGLSVGPRLYADL